MHTKRKPVSWEDKDTEPRGDPRRSQKCLQPWQWNVKWSRCRHSQFCGSTTWGLCEPCCPSLCLIPAGAWLSWGLEGASHPASSSSPWCLPVHWNRALRVTGLRNTGTAMGKGTVKRRNGAASGHAHSDPGEGMREGNPQGRGGEAESGNCSFDLLFLRHSWGSP